MIKYIHVVIFHSKTYFKFQGKTIPMDGGYFAYTRHEPVRTPRHNNNSAIGISFSIFIVLGGRLWPNHSMEFSSSDDGYDGFEKHTKEMTYVQIINLQRGSWAQHLPQEIRLY